MITRDIYRDFYRSQEGPKLEDTIFLVAKRALFGVAGVAVVLGVLDIAGVRSLNDGAGFVSNSRITAVAFADAVRSGISDISMWRDPSVARVKIPSAPVQVAQKVAAKPAEKPLYERLAETPVVQKPAEKLVADKPKAAPNSSVDRLASLAGQDAYAMALSQPQATFAPPLRETPQLATYSPVAPVTPPPALALVAPPSQDTLSTTAAIPLSLVPLPRAAPGVPPPSPAERLGLLKDGHEKDFAKAQRCLANAIYFEARSEPVRGQMAVAQVVVNRAFSGFYPDDVCSVVYQNAHRHLSCQFTFACDGKSKAITERGHWARANRIAKQTLEGQIYLPEVGKSTHYHASYVRPNWVREMRRLAHYGLHSFYRPIAWGNGADEPSWGTAALAARAEAPSAAKTKTR